MTFGTPTVSYDSNQTTVSEITGRIEKAGYSVETTGEETTKFTVPEMDCPFCAGKIENALEGLAGISTFDTQPTTGKVAVTYNPSRTTATEITAAIEGTATRIDGELYQFCCPSCKFRFRENTSSFSRRPIDSRER